MSEVETATGAAVWERLDPRMLLIHPLKEGAKFLPVLLGLVVAGGVSGSGPWALLGVLVPVALGIVRYFTTTYRVTAGRIELRRGLLQRHTLSTPVDRVRTVDLTASVLHRMLGLATVVIGTGSVVSDADERLSLDALPREQANALRVHLLGSRQARPADEAYGGADEAPSDEVEQVVARFSPRWLWYAPFSGTAIVAFSALTGVALQFSEGLDIEVSEEDLAAIDTGFILTIVGVVALLAVVVTVGGYLLTNAGFLLSRHGAAWHVHRGLLTKRETSIDVARLAGVNLGEPALLRLANGRSVSAIVTGLDRSQASSSALLPPAPAETAYDVARTVLGTAEPIDGPLLTHGRAATTRRYTRALLGASPFVVLLALAVAAGASPWLLVASALPLGIALALATDRARSLGHAHHADHVVMRSGSLTRARSALGSSHVIGWNLRATWFQRRAGLVHLAATTAGGGGRIDVDDVPTPAALALAEAATPGLLSQFFKETP
ncbi:PH domain-containing protein [Nocardioides sp. WS12]|uniref:PH domain-containing protein n=1 Tax=Nocardioides sp. WS12 TaxID=2486272 RepID=UPI0015FAAAE5|nr:PH domain-containing protein [Nocardioides sp. WS12]